jgi:dTMP kinase
MLGEYLHAKKCDVVVTQEPGGTEIGNQIRDVILNPNNKKMTDMTEVLLYVAARMQHVSEVIVPALTEGKIVLCSRFIDSTYAYQGFGAGVNLDFLKKLTEMTVGKLQPDLTIVYDLDPTKGLDRVVERSESDNAHMGIDRMESKEQLFHSRVREGFLTIAREDPQRIKIVDASGSVLDVFEKTKAVIDHFLVSFNREGELL